MPRAALSRDEIEAFRSRALEAAEELFAEGGVAGVTMRALSKALGCSPMTAYRYFDNQEHLMAALRAQAFGRLALSQRAAAEATEEPLARIKALRLAYIRFAIDEPHAYQLMFSFRPPREPRPELDASARESFAHLLEASKEAVASGVLEGDGERLAHLLWAELHGLVSLHVADKLNFGLTLKDLAEHSLLSL